MSLLILKNNKFPNLGILEVTLPLKYYMSPLTLNYILYIIYIYIDLTADFSFSNLCVYKDILNEYIFIKI